MLNSGMIPSSNALRQAPIDGLSPRGKPCPRNHQYRRVARDRRSVAPVAPNRIALSAILLLGDLRSETFVTDIGVHRW